MPQSLTLIAERLRSLKPALAAQFGISAIAIFGSHARHEANEDSDLDLLVDFVRTPSLFELARLDHMLERALSIKVDTVPRDSLNPRYAPYIMQELVPV